jgi:hypothetical protein
LDLGFASTVIPLVGNRFNDRELVGRYVHAAIRLRVRSFLILAPFALGAFVAIAQRHHWNWKLEILPIVPVLVALYSSRNVSIYAPQTLSGLVQLGAYMVLQITGALNAWTAAALSALT